MAISAARRTLDSEYFRGGEFNSAVHHGSDRRVAVSVGCLIGEFGSVVCFRYINAVGDRGDSSGCVASACAGKRSSLCLVLATTCLFFRSHEALSFGIETLV